MVFGKLVKAYIKGEGSVAVVAKSVAGPSSYTTGGFVIVIGELESIEEAIVQLREQDNNYRIKYAKSGNTITVQVFTIAANTTTGAITATEVAAGTDLSGLNFDVIAVGN